MKFEKLHKLVIYGLVCVGLTPLVLSGELPPAVVLGLIVAVGYSMVRRIPRQRSKTRTRFWNTITVLGLLCCVGLAALSGRWLLYAILFALLMVVTRLYQSRGSRDVFQLIGLSFVALVAGAVVNPSFSFIIVFVLYVILLIWALVLLHLQRDIEALAEDRNPTGAHEAERVWHARSLIQGRFLLGSSGFAMMVLLGSTIFFFLCPRLGMGFFVGQGRSSKKVSGFSNQMELGHFGTIKDDMDVVVRVAYPDDPKNAGRRVRLRGISFDNYDGRRWSKTQKRSYALPLLPGGKWAVMHGSPRDMGFPEGAERLVQDIYLEPLDMDNRMIFGEPRMITVGIDNAMLDRLKRDRTRFYQDRSSDVMTRGRKDTAIRYTVVSARMRHVPEKLRKLNTPLSAAMQDLYLQLPDDMNPKTGCAAGVKPRPRSCVVPDLARKVTAGATNTFDKVRKVALHLRSGYRYSTRGGHDLSAPVADFLSAKKWGHCEYFASAMVLMLRTTGVAARPANGFFGGAYNRYGNYYAVRQADAHSWVEVYYPTVGWLTYDPTPPSMVLVPPDDGFWADVTAFFDSLKLKWYRWVVEYDLEKQLEVFKKLGKMLSGVFPSPDGKSTDPKAWKRGVKSWAKDPNTWMLFGIPVLLFFLLRSGLLGALFGFLLRRLRRKPRETQTRMAEIYARMLVLLAKRGLIRRGAETPREFAARVGLESTPVAPWVSQLTTTLERVVYGEAPFSRAHEADAEAALSGLKESLG